MKNNIALYENWKKRTNVFNINNYRVRKYMQKIDYKIRAETQI